MNQDNQPSFKHLLANDPKLRAFNDTVPAGILVIGLDDGQVVFSNRFFDDTFGVSGKQLLGKNWEDFFVDHNERQQLMMDFAVDDEVRNFKLRLRGPNGKTIWGLASLSMVPLLDEDMLLFAFTDISELKRTEMALSRTTAEHQAISQTVPAGILVIGLDNGNVVYSNRFISDLLGVDGDKLLGTNWDNFFVDQEERQRMMIEFAVNDEVRDFELRLRDQKGETVWGLASLSMIEMEHEDLLMFGFSDVTRLKQVEMELSSANKELEELADIKNKFLGMAAHDLRTPIGAIRGMSELISRLDLAEDKKTDLVSSIMEVSDQMLTLLNDLLDVSAIENGTFDLDLKPGDLGELLRQRVDLISFSAGAKGIAIETSTEDHPPFDFDHSRISQVVDNLLTNAVKFSERDQTVEATVTTDKGSVILSVRDNGVGIAEAEVDKLFQPFEKLSSRPTAGEKSTGLGLSIAKRIVDAHDGGISVESKKGEGTTFMVSLPLVTQSHESENGGAATLVEHYSSQRSLRILVVEDNNINHQIIAAFLDEFGHTHKHAEHGEQAIEMHQSDDFELILMDVQMPVLSGPEATRRIREMTGKKAKIPIIALTANTTETHRKEYLQAGMNGVVTKPVGQAILATTINLALGEEIHVANAVVAKDAKQPAIQNMSDSKEAKSAVDDFLRQIDAADD